MIIKKRFRLTGLIIALSVLAVIAGGCDVIQKFASQPTSREQYRRFDFNHDPWLLGFNEAYEAATHNRASWTKAPKKVALRIAGYPTPDKVSVFNRGTGRTTVIVLKDPVREDDSIAAAEIRFDFVQNEDRLEIEWAGGRWRCQPGRGQSDWGPELCR